ncbi:acetyl-CoA acetyltransferase [Halobellus salinus]|uniref:Acetyl-CoA acetyltransferase n=1 Tax=Halobellus salinus TaxID=931585 RepID=A0A830EEU7_9EURY|nr:thiolase family protein [Halobellus salinus]GGJ03433.1 acetyl-CoA acetyltransferase [Halobellus salinus]SMP21391.1 3-ketoacyl-CoA thiolase [Halobellus salinus]
MTADTTPVIVAAARTAQGTRGGVFSTLRSEDLSVAVIDDLLARTGLGPGDVDDLTWGCAQQTDEQGNNLARVIALLSALGESVPAVTINRWCASSAAAITRAADAVAAGQRTCVVAGGVENMTRVGTVVNLSSVHPAIDDRYGVDRLRMGTTAETVAEEYAVRRTAQDEYALRSHRRAADATDEGRFDDEIVPVETDEGVVTRDEGIRRDTSLEALADLPPAFADEGTVTAGNASQISDGAAGVVVTSRAFAADHGLSVLAAVGAHEVAGVDPTVMGIGPVPAVRRLCERTGRAPGDYDLVELNEAFASQCVYCKRELGVDDDRFNVNGGAIALGHPLGATGARLPVTLLHEMRRRGSDLGLATECVGFGQGQAVEFVAR